MDGPFYTVSEATRLIGMSDTTAYKLIDEHKLGQRTVGGRPLLTEADVHALVGLKKRVGRPSKPREKKGV